LAKEVSTDPFLQSDAANPSNFPVCEVRSTRLKKIYCCKPDAMERKEADRFDYKLRSLAEVQE